MIIKNALVFNNKSTPFKGNILISGERITKVFAANEDVKLGDGSDTNTIDDSDSHIIDASGLYAFPGLVDMHLHGAVNEDFCDSEVNGIIAIARYELENGVMAICPTTMTIAPDRLKKAVKKIETAMNSDSSDTARIVGINMEGPFISAQRAGAQAGEHIAFPDKNYLESIREACNYNIKVVNVAPELPGAMELIDAIMLRENTEDSEGQIIVSVAHTDSDYDTAKRAFEHGANHVTHLFNAMPGISHRMPGPIIAAKEAGADVELIADGVHVHPAMVRFVFDYFGQDKVILISDSMEATGLGNGSYSLGGQPVDVCDGTAVLADSDTTEPIIAGSVTNLYECMKKCVRDMDVCPESAIRAASYNPAKALGIEKDYGSLDAGCYADIILADKELNIVKLIKHGKEI